MFKLSHILVTTDFSEDSLAALEEATRWAARFGATIHLLHVIEDEAVCMGADYPFGGQTVQETMTAAAEKRLAHIQTRYSQFPIYPQLRFGKAAQEIVACAQALGADLIVTTTHGRSRIARVFLGGTAEEVVRMASCAVLTVPPPG